MPEPGPDGRQALGDLVLGKDVLVTMVAHCIRAYPEEGCGLLVGDAGTAEITRCVPTTNVAASASLYVVDSKELLQADRAAEADGLSIIGVFHSHTHTDAYPSSTDVAQAFDPGWHYVLVSLRDELPVVRSYRIIEGAVREEFVHEGPLT